MFDNPLVILGFFIFGWILSKMDSASRFRKILVPKIAEHCFTKGAEFGYNEALKAGQNGLSASSDKPVQMGFSIPTSAIKKDDSNDN